MDILFKIIAGFLILSIISLIIKIMIESNSNKSEGTFSDHLKDIDKNIFNNMMSYLSLNNDIKYMQVTDKRIIRNRIKKFGRKFFKIFFF